MAAGSALGAGVHAIARFDSEYLGQNPGNTTRACNMPMQLLPRQVKPADKLGGSCLDTWLLARSKAALAYTCKIRQHVAHQIAARGPVWAVIYRNRLCTIQPYFAAWVCHIRPLSHQHHMRHGHMHAMHGGSKCYSTVSPSVVPCKDGLLMNADRRRRSTSIT